MNVKRVLRDGLPVVKGQCPLCGLWAGLDPVPGVFLP